VSELQTLDFIKYADNRQLVSEFNLSLDDSDYDDYDTIYRLVIDCNVSPKIKLALESKSQELTDFILQQ
jgi:hypothetical protein